MNEELSQVLGEGDVLNVANSDDLNIKYKYEIKPVIRVATHNVRGLRKKSKQDLVAKDFYETDVEILIQTETWLENKLPVFEDIVTYQSPSSKY